MSMSVENGQKSSNKTLLWVVLGCFGVSALCVVGVLVFAGGIVGIAFGAIRSSDVYQMAMDRALSHPEVVEVLGEPIKAGILATGSINVYDSEGSADFGIPLKGSRENGTLHAAAVREGGQWRFTLLELELAGQPRRINLLEP